MWMIIILLMCVQVSEELVELTPIQLFAQDVYQLLLKSDGRLPLGSFDAAYHRSFGSPPLPAQFGCSSTLALLQSVDHVVSISGRGSKRLLVLNNELAGLFTCWEWHICGHNIKYCKWSSFTIFMVGYTRIVSKVKDTMV